MYPYKIIWGLTLYEIFLTAGVLAALIVLRVLSDKRKFESGLFNFCLGTGVVAIIGGYASAILFQAYYDYKETGVFEITQGTGATFYGGLIGGAAVFLIIYFGVGHFIFRDKQNQKEFFNLTGMAACSITAAHSLGRVGCLMAGCCHGVASQTCGIHLDYPGYKVIPVQLYEALFLGLLAIWFVTRVLRGKSYNFPIYMISYGIWRFFIEYFRGDDRGSTFISFLSPSQLTAIVLIFGGLVFWYFEKRSISRSIAFLDDEVK